MCRMFVLALCCFGLMVAIAQADDVPQSTDAAVREAVSRSLPFLEKEGVAWMNDRSCMSCHHMPFLLWSHRAAQAHGLAVDATKLAEWDEWSRKDSLAHRNTHRLQNYDLGKVEAAKLPDAVKEKLKPLIEQPFKIEAEFVAKLRQQLLDVRNSDGGWGWEKDVPSDSLTTGLAIYVLAKVRAGDDSTIFRDARQWLLKSQQSDGSWLTPSKNITKSTEPERLKARDEIYHYWGTA